jgi:hypothetical protein
VPTKLTNEFLLVDLVNNLGQLEEDQSAVMAKVKEKALFLDQTSLCNLAEKFGKVRTRKLFKTLLGK